MQLVSHQKTSSPPFFFNHYIFCRMQLLYSSHTMAPQTQESNTKQTGNLCFFCLLICKDEFNLLIKVLKVFRINSASFVLKNSMPTNRLPTSSLYSIRQSKECASQPPLLFSCCANALLQSNKWLYFTCIRVDACCYVEVTKCICLMGDVTLNLVSTLLIWQYICVGNQN